jgi:hypothetical protein
MEMKSHSCNGYVPVDWGTCGTVSRWQHARTKWSHVADGQSRRGGDFGKLAECRDMQPCKSAESNRTEPSRVEWHVSLDSAPDINDNGIMQRTVLLLSVENMPSNIKKTLTWLLFMHPPFRKFDQYDRECIDSNLIADSEARGRSGTTIWESLKRFAVVVKISILDLSISFLVLYLSLRFCRKHLRLICTPSPNFQPAFSDAPNPRRVRLGHRIWWSV